MGTSKSLSPADFMSEVERISREAVNSLAAERRDNAQRRVDGLVSRSAIPPRYLSATLVSGTAEQESSYEIVRKYFAEFSKNLRVGKGLLLVGDVGTGKTHLACALANAVMADMRPVMYCTALEAVLLVKKSWSRGADGVSEFDVYEHFAIPELLIIDEIGVQKGSDFERMVLTAILDARSRRCLPTVAISNLDAASVLGVLDERGFDRLMGFGGQVIEMRGPSLRRLRLV